jgi:hypothetical protein
MSKLDRIDWLAQERIDIPDLNDSQSVLDFIGVSAEPPIPAFRPKSYNEILQDMLVAFQAEAGIQDIRPGGVMATMFSVMAQQMVAMQTMMAQTLTHSHFGPNTWTYPDGTKSMNAPKDGEVFRCFSANQTKEDCYVWSDKNQNWKWIGAKLLAPVDTPIIIHLGNMDEPKCECGSEAAGSNKHSSWCKKFNPNT